MNRAILYIVIETGMRRSAAARLNFDDVDFRNRPVKVFKKGEGTHSYKIIWKGLRATQDYVDQERWPDFEK